MGTADGSPSISLFAGTRSCLTIVLVHPVHVGCPSILPSWKTPGLELPSRSISSESPTPSFHAEKVVRRIMTFLVTGETSNVLQVSLGLDTTVVAVQVHATIFGPFSCTWHTRSGSELLVSLLTLRVDLTASSHPPTVQPLH